MLMIMMAEQQREEFSPVKTKSLMEIYDRNLLLININIYRHEIKLGRFFEGVFKILPLQIPA